MLTKIETSGLSTELIWDEFANFGFFKESNDESQVPQIHKPFQSPTALPDINSIHYDIINCGHNYKEMNLQEVHSLYSIVPGSVDGRLYYLDSLSTIQLFIHAKEYVKDKLYFFPKLFYNFIDENTKEIFPVMIFLRVINFESWKFLLDEDLNERIKLVTISFRGQTAQTEGKKSVLYRYIQTDS